MKLITLISVLFLSLFSSEVMAEGACPSGYYQTTPAGPGPIGCAPVPTDSAPITKWLDRWGSLASDGQGNWGISMDTTSKKNAISAALNECKLRGGKACEIRLTYKNQCAAVVADGLTTSTASDRTEKEAISRATSLCEEDDGPKKCWTYYSGCSLPVRSDG